MIIVNSQKYEYSDGLTIKDMIEKYKEYDETMKISKDLMVVLNNVAVKVEDIEKTPVKDGDAIVLLHSIAGG